MRPLRPEAQGGDGAARVFALDGQAVLRRLLRLHPAGQAEGGVLMDIGEPVRIIEAPAPVEEPSPVEAPDVPVEEQVEVPA